MINPVIASNIKISMLLNLCQQLIQLIYPSLCLSCQQRANHSHLLCPSCSEHLTLIDPEHRCKRCFGEIDNPGVCPSCRQGDLFFKSHAAVCERMGPPLALLSYFQRGDIGLAKTIASLMVVQHTKLNWPLPDWIIPYPLHLFPRLSSGGKLTHWVAAEIGKLLGKPLCSPLYKAINSSYFTQREEKGTPLMLRASFSKDIQLADRTLLLVSLAPDLDELKVACRLLQEEFPRQIFSLSFLTA